MNNKIQTLQRKRGRPAGKHRVPLSQEERRARNAQYERERRNEHAKAVSELIDASGFDPRMSFENLLRHVCCYFQAEARRGTDESVESLRQINTDLLQKIEQTEASLAAPTPPQSPTEEEDTCMRTRPYIYLRKVKNEREDPIEPSPINIQSIKTEVDMDYGPEQTTELPERAQVKTEVEYETMPYPHLSRDSKPVKKNVKGSRPHKIRKINHNTSVAVYSNPTDATLATQSKRNKVDHEFKPQGTEQVSSQYSNKIQADPLILGLFTEAEAKHDIVQYYINLLKEEGYDGGASSNREEGGHEYDQQTHIDHAVLRTTHQG